MRRAALLALALALAACSQTRRVGRPEAASQEASAPDAAAKQRKHTVKAAPDRPPVPATPQSLLKPGGAEEIQQALASKGYLDGQPSGTLDARTSAALRKYQADEGLAATGFADRETLRHLGIDPQSAYRTTASDREEGEPARDQDGQPAR